MARTTAPRNTTTRDKHRAAVSRGKPPCWLCHEPIDYSLPHLDPWSFQVDHEIPLAQGGTDTLDNCRPSHRYCNRLKSDKLIEDTVIPAPRVFVTERTW